MERNEIIEVLMEKSKVSREVAVDALERCSWDLLEAITYLENNGQGKKDEQPIIIEVKEEKDNKNHGEKFGGIGEVIGRMFKFIGKIIKKGNDKYFEIKKDNEKPIRISLTVSILLLVFLWVPTIALLVIGLFCGYRYSITGGNSNYENVNTILNKVSNSAETIKKDFKEGYNN